MKLIIPGNPPRKDDHWTMVRGKGGRTILTLTKSGKKFRFDVRNAIRGLLDQGETFPEGPLFAVAITMYVVQNRNLGDVTVPRRDVDSAISPVLDALQYAGMFGAEPDADVRVEHLYPPRRFKDAKNPRIEIEVTTWTETPPSSPSA